MRSGLAATCYKASALQGLRTIGGTAETFNKISSFLSPEVLPEVVALVKPHKRSAASAVLGSAVRLRGATLSNR